MTEEHTSKTRAGYGTIKHTVSGQQHAPLANSPFPCASCNLSADRVINAARNILIRCLAASQAQKGMIMIGLVKKLRPERLKDLWSKTISSSMYYKGSLFLLFKIWIA
ncbi:uncharacterized protein CYBJADRAFT_170054 [Cyberlindnera jadinii NRRL Y-1542]|uniref:Uncharacterized protein n=1 Tax=Cyberlindnera jadinii (strain ATCC 18201 / CBS 1600 / BCRC 20928 / JCM 3617 / NBRC 0987 / NRRL Y-1542) TaxID=983966 RepID=A0A1E4RTT7_CYBJN|nr:hypothetical protein CYBJADRAFT_170054 [Cyberlindnera jadinii NRRL Y-1542]ODV70687.1 hypothetical protein CYBJADRAFT_170054 [Cyberlindnera jadinii NRRL Y-1542]